jgi:hypothetical protein
MILTEPPTRRRRPRSNRYLTDAQISAIRRSPLTCKECGERYGVSHVLIWKIRHFIVYRDPLSVRAQ